MLLRKERLNLENKILIGVDFGGTKILTGAMTGEGKVVAEPVNVPTGGHDPHDKIIGRLNNSIEEALRRANANLDDVLGIGHRPSHPVREVEQPAAVIPPCHAAVLWSSVAGGREPMLEDLHDLGAQAVGVGDDHGQRGRHVLLDAE